MRIPIPRAALRRAAVFFVGTTIASNSVFAAETKPKIAVFSGPTSTIQNNKPQPTATEIEAIKKKIALYQEIFQTH